MNVANIFPIPVGMFEYGKLSDKELEAVKSFEMVDNVSNTRSVNQNVINDERLAGLKDFIEASLKVYLAETLSPAPEMAHYLTNSWVNITNVGQHHQVHSHINSVVSGTYYVDVENDKDALTFTRDDANNSFMSEIMVPDITMGTPYNCKEWYIPVQTGQLLLFPSSIEHGVPPREDRTKDRISISFNTFVKGLVSKGGGGAPRIYI